MLPPSNNLEKKTCQNVGLPSRIVHLPLRSVEAQVFPPNARYLGGYIPTDPGGHRQSVFENFNLGVVMCEQNEHVDLMCFWPKKNTI